MSERKHLHIELGISTERMYQMRDQVTEQIRNLEDEEGDQEDMTFYSQVVIACSHVPNDTEEAILLGMIIGRALISYELAKLPIIGPMAISAINQIM
jgi:hypothetical protein